MKKEYKEQMDNLHFSQQQKQQMVDRLMAAQDQQEIPRRKRRPLHRIAAVGVAAALVLTAGAGATVVYHKLASESFAGVFGTAETEIVDKIGRPIGASDTSNGVTITADAIIGDKYHYAITYSIEKEDGTAFDITTDESGYYPMMFQKEDTNIGRFGSRHGSSYFYDADPTDNAIQYVEMMEVDRELKHRTAKVTFEDLRLFGDGEHRMIAEGNWKLKFDFNFEDTSVSLPAGQEFELNGMGAVIDEITISPIALRVAYTVDEKIQWDENTDSGKQSEHDREQMFKYFESLPVTLTKTDSTVLDLTGMGGGVEPKDGKTVCSKGTVFDEIIPLEEVDHITVAGIEIPLHK